MEAGRIFKKIAQRSGLGCFAWSVSGNSATFCSEHAAKLFGAELDAFDELDALVDSDYGRRLAAAVSARVDFSLELKMKNARWIGLHAMIDDAEGEPRWIGTVEDITHRIASWQGGKAADELYRNLAENSPAMLWMGDASGKCIFLNTALWQFWGIDPQDLSLFDWSSTTHPQPEEFLSKFNARLRGLAASNDLLVKNEWGAVGIEDLLSAQLGHLGETIGTRLTWHGPPIQVGPKAAQTLGMAFHELSTNSLKHGALAVSDGRVSLEWQMTTNAEIPAFSMSWREFGLSGLTPPDRKGFGSMVLGEMITSTLDADVQVEYPSTGMVWRFTTRSAEAISS